MNRIFFDTWFHLLVRLVMIIYFKLFYNITIKGRMRIPLEGPVIIAPNHVSFYDPPLTGLPVPRVTYFMSKLKYMKSGFMKFLLEWLRAFPISGEKDRKAYANMLRVLKDEKALVVFPEGTRSATGKMLPIQSGVPRMALKTGATIVPMSICGTYEAWPPGRKLPILFKKIILKFHEPIPVEVCTDKDEMNERIEELREKLGSVLGRRMRAWEVIQNRKK